MLPASGAGTIRRGVGLELPTRLEPLELGAGRVTDEVDQALISRRHVANPWRDLRRPYQHLAGRRGESAGLLHLTRNARAADHVPRVPSGRIARTRHHRSPVAVNDAATCEAVTVRSMTVVVNALEELAWSV